MILEMPSAEIASNSYEVVIIGAGAVGLTMGVVLARQGLRVAILEAGPSVPEANSQKYFENATSVGASLPGLHFGRFRALGGTTNFWGGQLVEFGDHIFNGRPELGCDPWGISKEELSSHYEAILDLLDLRKLIDDEKVWDKLKTAPPANNHDIRHYFSWWTKEPNFVEHFKEDIEKSEELHLFLNAPVTKIGSVDTGRIESVEVKRNDGITQQLSGKKFILANGTIEIVRLLLQKNENGLHYPWEDNSWIGKGFMDHLDCYAGKVKPLDKRRFSELFDNAFIDGLKYCPKLHLSPEIQEKEQLLDISGHFIFKSSVDENLANLKIFLKGLVRGRFNWSALKNPLKAFGALRFAIPMVWRYMKHYRMYNIESSEIILRLTSEQTPIPESEIRLNGATDDLGVANIEVDWKFPDNDMRTLQNFALKLKTYLEDQKLAKVELNDLLERGDFEFMNGIDDANHHMGGARMASDARYGVVDKNLKVFGTDNLFVAGAAVFPSSGFANPTFTAMALGARLVNQIVNNKI